MSESYSVLIKPAAWKQIMAFDARLQNRVFDALETLEGEPRPARAKKLQGNEELYRVRVGDYRIVYEVRDAVLIVVIVEVGNRSDVYKKKR